MKSRQRILKIIHRWLGLMLCLSLLVMSVTGAMLVWKKEYLWLSFDEARAALQTDSVSLAQAIERIERIHPQNELSAIQLHSNDLSLHKVYLADGQAAWHNQAGEKLTQWQANGRFEDWLLDLHHRFLLGNRVGLNIAGLSGLLLIPLVLLGVVIWWPRRQGITRGVLPKSMSRPYLINSHGNLGAFTFIPILLIAITGIILVYPQQSQQVLLEPFLDEASYEAHEGPLDSLVGNTHSRWLRVIERSRAMYPEAKIRWVRPASDFSEYRIVGLQQKGDWNQTGSTTIYIDAAQGFMDVNIDQLRKSNIERVFDFAAPLHTGNISLWYRLLLFCIGLAMSAISFFGLASFLKKR